MSEPKELNFDQPNLNTGEIVERVNPRMDKILKTVRKNFPGYEDVINAMSERELKEAMVQLNKGIDDIAEAKSKDKELINVSELKSELEAPYNEMSKKAETKLTFLSIVYKDKYAKVEE